MIRACLDNIQMTLVNIDSSQLLTVLVVCAHVERKTLDMMMACGAANPLKAIVQQIKPMVQIGT